MGPTLPSELTQGTPQGSLEILTSPSRGRSISKIRKTAAASDSQNSSVASTVPSKRAKRPNPLKRIVNQHARITRKGTRMELPRCANISQRTYEHDPVEVSGLMAAPPAVEHGDPRLPYETKGSLNERSSLASMGRSLENHRALAARSREDGRCAGA
jgi:hypothetical protein